MHNAVPGPLHRYVLLMVRVLAAVVMIGGSLLTFPTAIPWVIAAWLAWHGVLAVRGKVGWEPIVACALILLIKRVPLTPGLATVALAVSASMLIALLPSRRGRPPPAGSVPSARLALLSVAAVVFALDWHSAAHATRQATIDNERPIVCLGDSLTADMPPAESYPTRLAQQVGPPVINLGQPGISARHALKQLPELIALRPQAVVVELGGHDYLHGRPRSDTLADLERIIAAARSVEAEVLLIEVPRGFIVDPYRGLERDLARRHDLELISDSAIRQCVIRSSAAPPGIWLGPPYLSEDGLHPNTAGADLLAHDVAAALARLFGPGVLRSPDEEP